MKQLAAALAVALAAALFIQPSAAHVPGWGDDPYFNLWTLEVIYGRIAAHGPLWFFDLEHWRTQLYAGAEFGLAYSENQIWLGLLTYLPFKYLQSAALALQLYMIAACVLTAAATYFWLRKRTRYAIALAAFFATSGWLQSQAGQLQISALFTLPLAALALDRLREKPSLPNALLLGASLGWIPGWNLYYFCFALAAALIVLTADLVRRNSSWLHALAVVAAAALVAAPILRPYLLLDQALGAHPALSSYGLHPLDLIARLHSPPLLWPAIEARDAAGGMPVLWLLLLIPALFLRKSRPWVLAAAMTFWLSAGSTYGAWQTLGWLPGLSSLRAIGRVQIVTIALSLPALGAMLEAMPPKLAGVLVALLLAESIPKQAAENLPIPQSLPAPPFAIEDGLLVLPPPDAATMVALLPWRVSYQGGYSGFAPPGQELLQASWDRGETAALLNNGRYVLARSPEAAALIRKSASIVREAPAGASNTLFEIRPGPLLDPIKGTTARDSLDLYAKTSGTLSIARIDQCFLEITTNLGPLHLRRKTKLQGNEFLKLQLQPGELVFRHRTNRWASTSATLQCS